MRRLVYSICIAQSGKAPSGSFHSSQSSDIRTEPVRPCCTENRFPNIVVRSIFMLLAACANLWVGFSWTTLGFGAFVIHCPSYAGLVTHETVRLFPIACFG
jgi:hypothetical protein